MNEENNLNTVPQTNPEPVTPVEPVQQPVAPVQPTTPVTPAPQIDAEAIMEQKVVEMEQEMMKEKIELPVEQTEEAPAEEVVAQPVEPQIDPSFGTNVQPPVQPLPAPTKKKSKLPVVLVVLVILAAGGFACWKFVLPKLNKAEATTTTTSAKEESSIPQEIKDYNLAIKDTNYEEQSASLLFVDNNFKKLDIASRMNANEKCKTAGEQGSLVVEGEQGYKIDYTCTSVGTAEVDGRDFFYADVVINDTFKLSVDTDEGFDYSYFTNDKVIVGYLFNGSNSNGALKVIDTDNQVVLNEYGITIRVSFGNESIDTYPYVKDNVLYYIIPTNPNKDLLETASSIQVKSFDLNTKEEKIIKELEYSWNDGN